MADGRLPNRPSLEQVGKYISVRADYVDPETAERCYRGFVRYILDTLRDNDKIALPKLGTFRVHLTHARSTTLSGISRPNGPERVILPEIRTLKFTPCTALKLYIRNKLRPRG